MDKCVGDSLSIVCTDLAQRFYSEFDQIDQHFSRIFASKKCSTLCLSGINNPVQWYPVRAAFENQAKLVSSWHGVSVTRNPFAEIFEFENYQFVDFAN